MEGLFKIVVGLALMGLGLAYLYNPALVLKVNEIGRSIIFNDAHVLYFRRRWGVGFFILSLVFFFSGFNHINVKYYKRQNEGDPVAVAAAYNSFFHRKFKDAQLRCEAVLSRDPENVHAQILLANCFQALGENDKAEKIWKKLENKNLVKGGKVSTGDESHR